MASEIATKLGETSLQNNLENLKQLTESRPEPLVAPQEGQITPEQEEEFVGQLLDAWGVDFDADDDIARAARSGLKDLNPERVYRWCEHLYTELMGQSWVGQVLGLPIGQKVFWCEYGGPLIAFELDEGLARYKQQFCTGCRYHSPRRDDWKWSHQWHAERKIPEELKRLISRISGHS